MGKPKMWDSSKTSDRTAKLGKIWISGYYSAYSEATFDARFLEYGLGSFGAFCKLSNFTIFKTLLFFQILSDFIQILYKVS